MKKYFADVNSVLFIIMSVKLIRGCDYTGKSINCSDTRLEDVPILLNPKVEVLDLSFNRIRRLYVHSFTKSSHIRVLILRQNFILSIEEDTFSHLTDLTDLDLSINVLQSIPCHLPASVRRLNLDDNRLDDEPGCLQCLSPLTSLETLLMRGRKLKKFPRFCESTPNLVELDVSGNPIDALAAEDLALLCGLRKLNISVSRNSQRDRVCECLQFKKWLKDHTILSTMISCSANNDADAKCNVTSTNETVTKYQECLKELEFRKLYYLWLIGGISLLVAGLCGTLYAVHRWRRKRSVKSLNIETAVNMNAVLENSSHVDKDIDSHVN